MTLRSRIIAAILGLLLVAPAGSVLAADSSIAPMRGLTISSPLNGNPNAIFKGFGELSKRQASILEKLAAPGDRMLLKKSGISQRDLAALTAKTGDEFTMFTAGGRRLVVRGNSRGFSGILDDAFFKDIASKGFRWSGHTHPIELAPGADFMAAARSALRSSDGDRYVLSIFQQNQSTLFNSLGGRRSFNQHGDLLTGWLP